MLNTYIKNRSYAYDVHFWLGDHSSVDERGAAALLTVHLDDSLGGVPVQHREVQGNESALFMSYFKHGIKYLEGGVDSAFKKVDRDSFPLRLFHVKGKREVRAIQVVVATKSMNHGDVFVLDAGRTIFFWAGAKSNKFERVSSHYWLRYLCLLFSSSPPLTFVFTSPSLPPTHTMFIYTCS